VNALLKVEPNAAPVQAVSGTLAISQKDYSRARRAFNRALEIQPDNLDAIAGIALVDLALKKPEDARAHVQRHLDRAPDKPALLLIAARIYATTGDGDGAEKALRRVIELEPSNFQAYGMLGQLYAMQRRIPEARTTFEAMLKEQPESVPINTVLAILDHVEGDLTRARSRYERVLQFDTTAAVAANNLAYLYAEQSGNLDVALQLAQTAKQQLPESPEVADTLGWIYVKKGLATLAVPQLEQAVSKVPTNPVYHYHLGVALAQAGQHARGKQALERALGLKLDDASAAEARRLVTEL
jgi:tetratricopeptide (TPR) repeat protein